MPRIFVSAVTQKNNALLAGDSQQEREQQAKRATVFDFDDREDDEEDAQDRQSTTDDSDNDDADRHDQSSPDLLRPGNVGIHPSCCLSSPKVRLGSVIVKSKSIDSGDISSLSADKNTDAGIKGLLKRDSRAVTDYVDEKATMEEDEHPARGKRPRSNDDAEIPRPSSLRDGDNALACLKESEIDAPPKHRAAANAPDGGNDGAGGSEVSTQEAREEKTQAERGQEAGNGSDVAESGYFTVVFATQKLGLPIAEDDSGSVVVCGKEEIVAPAETAAGRDMVSIGDRVVAIGGTRVAGLDMSDVERMLVRGPRPLEVEFHRIHQSFNIKVRPNESAAKHHVGVGKPASPWRQPLGGLERPSRDCLLDAIINIATQEDSFAEAQLLNGGQESQHEGPGAEVETAARNKVCVASSGGPSPSGDRTVERKHEDRIPSKDVRTNSLPRTVVCINGVGPPKESHHHDPNSAGTTSSSRASGGVAGAQRAQHHSLKKGPHREATENVLALPPYDGGTGAVARKKGVALRVAEHSTKGGENRSARGGGSGGGGGGYVGEKQPAQHQSHENDLRREATETLFPLPPYVGETGAFARQKGEALRLVQHSAKGGENGSARGGGSYVGEMQHAQHQNHEDGLRKEATKTSLHLPRYVGERGAVARQKGEVLRLVEHSAKGGENGSARGGGGYVGETQRPQHQIHEDGLHQEAAETSLPLPPYAGETVAVARQRGEALRLGEHSAKDGENVRARGGGGYVGGIQRAQYQSHEDSLHREATETLFFLPRYAGETGSIARRATFRLNEPSAKGGENWSGRGGGRYVGGIQRAQHQSQEDGLHREATESLFPLPPYVGETDAVAKQKGPALRLVEPSAKGGENGSARGGCVGGGIQRAQHQGQEEGPHREATGGLFPSLPYAGETGAIARQKGAALNVVEPSAKGGENGSVRGGGSEGGYRKRSKVKKPAGTSAPAATLPKMLLNGSVSSSGGAGAGAYGNDRKAQTAIPDMAEVAHILTKLGSRGVSELTLYKSLNFEELVRISRYAGVDVSKRLSKATMAERLNTLYVEKGILRREHFFATTEQHGGVQRSSHSRNDVAGRNGLDAVYHTQTSSDAAGELAIPVQNVSCARPLPRPFPPPQPLLPHPFEASTSSPRSSSAWRTSTAAAALDGGQILTPQPSRATWPLSPSRREGSPLFVIRPGSNGSRNLPASSPPLSAPRPETRRTGGVQEDYQQCWEDWDYRQHMAVNSHKRYDEGNGASSLFAARTGCNGTRNLPASRPPLSTPTPATPRRTGGTQEDNEQCWEDWDYREHIAVDRHKRYDEGSEASWWRGESDGYWTVCPSPPSAPRSPVQDYRGRGMREMHAPKWRNPFLPSGGSMRSTQATGLPDETTFAVLPRWTLRSVRTIGTQTPDWTTG